VSKFNDPLAWYILNAVTLENATIATLLAVFIVLIIKAIRERKANKTKKLANDA
tara:strand:- start:132 stop:293 length:162 start_codon:yes stop_codon:yes gene_type:complete